ncbi:hypothetical protein HYQ46_000290 [Verticillium longisporum]|nr:hypothetical protein HYQ46_000290 [Verticillium longisporum]
MAISASGCSVLEPSVVRLTAVLAPFLTEVEPSSAEIESSAPGPALRAPERASILSSPSPRMALISGASTTLLLKSTRFSETEPASTE